MADISQINLPDGTTNDIKAKKIDIQLSTWVGGSYPLLCGSRYDGSVFVTLNQPSVDSDGKLTCETKVTDISSSYSATKSSGNWSCAIDESIAYRTGNVIQFDLLFKGNGNAVSGPTNAFVGAISGGPLPVTQTTFCGYYNAVAVMGILDTDGSVSVRPLGTITLTSSNRCHIRATFICP